MSSDAFTVPATRAPRLAAWLHRHRQGLSTFGWAGPGTAWLAVFLLAPVAMIVLTSVWQKSPTGFSAFHWTLDNYSRLFSTPLFADVLRQTVENAVVVCAACLVIGYPIAYFLAVCVSSLRWQLTLFLVTLAPFWTAYLIRIIAWYPVLGREGALNRTLMSLGIAHRPVDFLLFSNFAVIVTLVQLYVLFMISPIFYQLATLDRSAVEAARDLGASSFRVFREVILPLSAPGVAIGTIFVFVLTMGDFATVQFIGGGNVGSVGSFIRQSYVNIDLPLAAAASSVLVLVMMAGVAVLARVGRLREAV